MVRLRSLSSTDLAVRLRSLSSTDETDESHVAEPSCLRKIQKATYGAPCNGQRHFYLEKEEI